MGSNMLASSKTVSTCVLVGAMTLTSSALSDIAAESSAKPGDPKPFVCIGDRPGSPGALFAGKPLYVACDSFDPNTPATTWSNPDYADKTRGSPSQFILVRLSRNGAAPVDLTSDISIRQVVIAAGDVNIIKQRADALDVTNTTIVVPLRDLRVLDNNATVSVRIDFNPDAQGVARQSNTSYFVLRNIYSFYGVFSTGAGFWIPYGLLATNFKSTADGIPLAAFPVGLAWGLRWYLPKSSFYVGTSAMVNWAIYATPQNAQGSAGQASGSSTNLQSLAYGGLVDVGGWIYVGGAYISDFRSGFSSPGGVVVLGAGPQLLQFLQSAKH